MPTGRTVRQPVLDHDADGGVDDAMRVMAVGQSQIGHVGVEVVIAVPTAVLRVGDVQLAGPAADRVAQIMQLAGRGPQSVGAARAAWTDSPGEVPRASNDAWSRQIFDAADAFRGVRQVRSRTGHGSASVLKANTDIGTKRTETAEISLQRCYRLVNQRFNGGS